MVRLLSRTSSGSRTVSTTICASERTSSILSKSMVTTISPWRIRHPDGNENVPRDDQSRYKLIHGCSPSGGSADNVFVIVPEVSQAPMPLNGWRQWRLAQVHERP